MHIYNTEHSSHIKEYNWGQSLNVALISTVLQILSTALNLHIYSWLLYKVRQLIAFQQITGLKKKNKKEKYIAQSKYMWMVTPLLSTSASQTQFIHIESLFPTLQGRLTGWISSASSWQSLHILSYSTLCFGIYKLIATMTDLTTAKSEHYFTNFKFILKHVSELQFLTALLHTGDFLTSPTRLTNLDKHTVSGNGGRVSSWARLVLVAPPYFNSLSLVLIHLHRPLGSVEGTWMNGNKGKSCYCIAVVLHKPICWSSWLHGCHAITAGDHIHKHNDDKKLQMHWCFSFLFKLLNIF